MAAVPAVGSSGLDHESTTTTTKITLKAAVIPNAFWGFQRDLLEHLQLFALEDNITLEFVTTKVQEVYCANLRLISPECDQKQGETVEINNVTYECDYDMIVGDFWPNPRRYTVADFTPPWLHTSISTIKYNDKTKFPMLDVTTLTEASVTGTDVCAMENSPLTEAVTKAFPQVNIVPCNPSGKAAAGSTGCINMLKNEQCSLWVSDELELRNHQVDDPSLEMTGEHLNRQLLAWPVRKSLDPSTKFLLNKWVYAAISNQTIDELYYKYFEKKLCPIGTSGKQCELPCDPNHGRSDSRGSCICESSRWMGDDCSIEVLEDHHLIPPTLKAVTYVMLAFNILAICGCGTWLCIYWESPQVRVSQPSFLLLVLMGCVISSSTVLALAQEDEEDGHVPACMVIPWLYSVGFAVTFGTLFAKIRRVYTLFTQECAANHQSAPNVRSWGPFPIKGWKPGTVQDTFATIGVVLLLDVIILVLWTAVDPLEWHHITIRQDKFGDPLESQGYCSSESWKIFSGIIGALHLGLLGLACCMCYMSRDIPTKYQEGKYVTIAIISNFQIFLVGVPVLILVGGDPETSFFLRSLIILMNDLAVVSLIFGNLMHCVHASLAKPGGNSLKADKCGKCQSPNDSIESGTNHSPPQSSESSSEELSFPPRVPPPLPPPSNKGRRDYVMSSLTDMSVSKKSVSFCEHVIISEYDNVVYDFDEEEEAKLSSDDRFSADPGVGSPIIKSRGSAMKKPIRQPSIIKIKVPAEPTTTTSCAYPQQTSHFVNKCQNISRDVVNLIQGQPNIPQRPPRLPVRVDSNESIEGELAFKQRQPFSPSSRLPPQAGSEVKRATGYLRRPGEA